MNSIIESRLLTPRPVAVAGPGDRTARAGAATAPAQDERPAARTQAPEPSRAQSAAQRLRQNRPEEALLQIAAGAPEAEFKFGDFLDLINPLQHIPIVSTIYRAITGDEISGPAKILGGMLFGGPIGFIAAIFDTIVAQATGRDLGETVLAAFTDEDAAPGVQVADARDLAVIAAQDDASEDGSPPVSGRRDPFGLQRETAAAIAVTPGAVPPGASGEAPEQPAAPGAQPPSQPARPLTVAAPWPQVAPVVAPVVAVELISADALEPGNPRLVPNLASADRGFAARMLEALDKYQAQAAERTRNSARATRRLDLAL